MMVSSTDVTLLLKRHTDGDPEAFSQLIPFIYHELHRLASFYLRGERPEHTLQTTALVHEAYLRLVDQTQVSWSNRNHFFAVAAQMMRRVLVDHARRHSAFKRGSALARISLETAALSAKDQPREVLVIDDLLNRLASFDPQAVRIIELRFFAGFSLEEAADVMGLSIAKIRREWSAAKAWLMREMTSEQENKRPN
jgi:RNA polymerase sigma factor (TIGR02999 family)